MKKRIILSTLVAVIFSLIVVTSSFIMLSNNKELEYTRETLKNYNEILINLNDYENDILESLKIRNLKVRFTLIQKNGEVTFDSYKDSLGNHSDREEIKTAFERGEGHATRYSSTQDTKVVYYATKVNDNLVLRSSVPLANVDIFGTRYFEYYILVMILAAALTFVFTMRFTKAILYPIEELEEVTSKIANGDLSKRVNVRIGGEIGLLGNRFNYMANELENTIYDAVDKQNKLEAILESMDGGVIAIDFNNIVMMINPYAKNIFGIEDEIIGESLEEYINDYDILEFVRKIPHIDSKEIKIYHPFEKILRIRKAPIINGVNKEIGIVVLVQDVTEIKNLENMRSQFVANVSHELKTPLTSIKGFAETLKYVEDNSTREKFLDIINKEAERLSRLINDILILSNIENCNEIAKEEFVAGEVIEAVINIVTPQADTKNITIEFCNESNETLVGNKDKYHQLVLNLVENAVKYTEENGKVNIKLYNKKRFLYLEIKDNGIGIPKEDLPRIFERFYRVDKARGSGGTGLGLAIAKHIAKMFNGEIFVTSKLGEGTTFIVKMRIG